MKEKTARRLYLREAAAMLVVSKVAVRLLPRERLFAWASRPPRRVRRFANHEINWVAWAVETVGAKPWMQALALPRALAAQAMFRRRGIPSRLCLGVARDGDALTAHAWIEIGGDKVLGGAAAARFTRLAEFGGERV